MSATLDPATLADRVQSAGVSGAGGGGFPAYVKWQTPAAADHLLVNHQESEPNCYVDKWLGREHADELAAFFEAVLGEPFETVVVGAKWVDRDPWVRPLEEATDATVYEPADLPVDPDAHEGVVLAYTADTYEYGMENVLLQTVADTVIGKDLPVDYGWVVQNTETALNIHRALADDEPVLTKWVQVDGYLADEGRLPGDLFEVPVGTPAADLLRAAEVKPPGLTDDRTLVEGGPGWCFTVDRPPKRFGVNKRTNCLLVLDADTVAEHTYGNGRVNVLEATDWSPGEADPEPTPLDPDCVRVPVTTNRTYDAVAPSTPTVELGERVARGDRLAAPTPDGEGYCVAHHSPIEGVVADITPTEVEVRRR